MTYNTHTDNEEPSTSKCPYYNDDCPKCHPTKSSGELEEILHDFGSQYEWPYGYMHDRERSPADQQKEARAELTAKTVAAINALHATQTTKLQADLSWCLGKLRGLGHPVEHLEREHKIGENR